jgi:hypothetical protein
MKNRYEGVNIVDYYYYYYCQIILCVDSFVIQTRSSEKLLVV